MPKHKTELTSKSIWKLLFQMETANEAPKPQTQWGGAKVGTKLGDEEGVWPARLPPLPCLWGNLPVTPHQCQWPLWASQTIKSLRARTVSSTYILIFYQDIYLHTVHITDSKNVSWIYVELTNELWMVNSVGKSNKAKVKKELKCSVAMERVLLSAVYHSKHSPTLFFPLQAQAGLPASPLLVLRWKKWWMPVCRSQTLSSWPFI